MRRIREILRLCWELKLGQPKVAECLGISSSTVNRLVLRAQAAGLSWPLPSDLDDTALERLLYPPVSGRPQARPEPDWQYVHEQLKQKGVTLVLLWQEYKEQHPDGYQLSQFCDRYRTWRANLNISMRQTHRAGEKAFSDFAGAKFRVIDQETGEVQYAYLFVSTLGASNYTYFNVFSDQSSESWCTGQAEAFGYFQGVPSVVVPDNPRSAVNKPCRYEPELNDAFREMAAHFGCAVIPARVRRPKDKSKVECAVGVVTKWVFARLRKRDFFSLEELRQAIRPLLEDLNNRPFKKLPGSRRTAFENIDKPALKPLPQEPYEYFEIHKAPVGIDHHVEFEGHCYSVPYQLVRKEVELRVTPTALEVLFAGKRVTSHARSFRVGQHTTLDVHRPKAHREYAQRSPQRLIHWAATFGPATTRVIELAFEQKAHPEEAYNRCFGILKLGKIHGADRLEAACQRGLATGAISYRSIKSILQSGLDRRPLPATQFPTQLRIVHHNIRGAKYFTSQGEQPC
jgi:transposase